MPNWDQFTVWFTKIVKTSPVFPGKWKSCVFKLVATNSEPNKAIGSEFLHNNTSSRVAFLRLLKHNSLLQPARLLFKVEKTHPQRMFLHDLWFIDLGPGSAVGQQPVCFLRGNCGISALKMVQQFELRLVLGCGRNSCPHWMKKVRSEHQVIQGSLWQSPHGVSRRIQNYLMI